MTPAEPVRVIGADVAIEMPIAFAVNAVLHAGADVENANSGLLARPFTAWALGKQLD